MQRKNSFKGRFWTRRVIRQHGYGYYKCYYCGNNSTGPDRYEITFMKYHPFCITSKRYHDGFFPIYKENCFHIFNCCHKIIWILFQLILSVLGKCPKNALAPPVPPKPIIIFFFVSILGQWMRRRRRVGKNWMPSRRGKVSEIFLLQHFGVGRCTRHLTSKKSSSRWKWVGEPD